MMDFNEDFEKYLIAWYTSRGQIFAPDDAEELVADVYAEWADLPKKELGGISPRAYFQAVTTPENLTELFLEVTSLNKKPCPLLLDRMTEVKECEISLLQILQGDYLPFAKITAVSFLNEAGYEPPLELYARMVGSPESSSALVDLCVEVLCENAEAAAPFLFPLLNNAEEPQKACMAEILICAAHDERTYALLQDLFENGSNVPLYAWYLGKYGDERAATGLYKKLDTCNYAEYLEVKNAIERMGGCVEDTRDFSNDADYQRIKGHG